MTTTVIALYDNAGKAQQALNELTQGGYNKNDIDLLSSQAQGGSDAIIGKLNARGIPKREAGTLAEAVRHGCTVIALDTPDEKAEDALAALNRQGARNIEEIEAELRKSSPQKPHEEARETVPVVEEHISVGKRRVLRGGVRVTSTVTETPFQEKVKLREESVDVERKHAERKLSPEEADKAFQEKTVQLTETAEEAVVNKEARVVEEVALRKSAQEREETVQDTVRRTDVKVEQVEPKARPEGQR